MGYKSKEKGMKIQGGRSLSVLAATCAANVKAMQNNSKKGQSKQRGKK